MLFAIMRRKGWETREELGEAGRRSTQAQAVEMVGRLAWIRSYFFREEDGTLGTICIYEADSPEDIREHARRAALPAQEILPIIEVSAANRREAVCLLGVPREAHRPEA